MRKMGEVLKLKCVLCKTGEFAGPHFDHVIVVHDGIIPFKAAMVEVCHCVDARCYDPGPHFSFSGPPFISQDIPCQPTPLSVT